MSMPKRENVLTFYFLDMKQWPGAPESLGVSPSTVLWSHIAHCPGDRSENINEDGLYESKTHKF